MTLLPDALRLVPGRDDGQDLFLPPGTQLDSLQDRVAAQCIRWGSPVNPLGDAAWDLIGRTSPTAGFSTGCAGVDQALEGGVADAKLHHPTADSSVAPGVVTLLVLVLNFHHPVRSHSWLATEDSGASSAS